MVLSLSLIIHNWDKGRKEKSWYCDSVRERERERESRLEWRIEKETVGNRERENLWGLSEINLVKFHDPISQPVILAVVSGKQSLSHNLITNITNIFTNHNLYHNYFNK